MNKTAVPGTAIAAPGEPETPSDQPARTSNIDAIVAYFESGITPAGAAGELGIELEPVSYTHLLNEVLPSAFSGYIKRDDFVGRSLHTISRHHGRFVGRFR